MTTTLMWFRRDLRLADNPALLAAIEEGDEGVVPVYVLDHPEWRDTRRAQRAYLSASIASFAERTKGLYVVTGNPAVELPRLAAKLGATRVHAAAAIDPLGRKRESAVARALAEAGGELIVTGSPYAILPGRITKPDGDPYRVYKPFFRGWSDHGWRAPAPKATTHRWIIPSGSIALPQVDPPEGMTLPPAGEPAA
ncbi:MAG: deoxyribodipyrimidine photolyase, partial [Nocardioidaceae bacterium]|nr:deoxyribodipyrimidine photolyase [Nocardioidaceae bacterium]